MSLRTTTASRPLYRVLVAGLVTGLTTGALAGCGSTTSGGTTATPAATASAGSASTSAGSPPARPATDELIRQAKAGALAAKSARVSGTVATNGKAMTLDIAGRTDGSNQRFQMTQAGLGSFELRTVAGKYYLKGDAAFWSRNTNAAEAKRAAGAFVAIPANQAKQLGEFTINSLLSSTFAGKEFGTMQSLTTEVTDTTVDGQPAYAIADRAGNGAQLVVSADGRARLLKLVGPTSEPGSLRFSEWDAVAPIAAPSGRILTSPAG